MKPHYRLHVQYLSDGMLWSLQRRDQRTAWVRTSAEAIERGKALFLLSQPHRERFYAPTQWGIPVPPHSRRAKEDCATARWGDNVMRRKYNVRSVTQVTDEAVNGELSFTYTESDT
jgi:hypothetical protein